MYKSLLLFALLSTTTLSAQSSTKELGIRFTGLDNYNLLFKKELEPDVYRRFNAAASNVALIATSETGAIINFNVSLSIGKEVRRPIGERLMFAHGWQPGFGVGFTNIDDLVLLTISPRVGYLLGFHYQVSDQFYFGVEVIPRASLGVTVGEITIVTLQAGLSSGGVGLTGVYRFGGGGLGE